ncbi:MAG TPA: hypothetical protein VHM19_08560 [Polyangiales bacterium]|jgi:hypothetical protein|nr:hypothetical protein [Polyangiales bacterium]
MARVCTVVLTGFALPLALGACGRTDATSALPRAESAIVVAHGEPPIRLDPAAPPPSAAPGSEPVAAPGPAIDTSTLQTTRDAWQTYLRSVPELARYARQFVPFNGKAQDEALRRGDRSRNSVTAWAIADGPIAWTPVPNAPKYWIAAGSIGERALIAVLEVQASGLRHAASLVIDDKDTSVAIGTSTDKPAEVLWSTCYGCPGEGGSILLGDDGHPRFVYR